MHAVTQEKGSPVSFNTRQAEYIERLRVQGYSVRTLKHVQRSTQELIEYFERQNIKALQEITRPHVAEYAEHLKTSKISSVYLANKYTDCRKFLNYLYEEGWTRNNHGLVFGKVIKRKSEKNILTQDEVARLLLVPDTKTKRGTRDRALLELLYSSGLRREEVIRLELYDLDVQSGTVKVTGKGDKQRIVPVGKMALYWIHEYIKKVRGAAKSGHLFVGIQTRRGLSGEYLGFLVKSCGKSSGIKKRITPHALRHACATHMLQNGAPSRMLQAFLGHEQLLTTQVYTHVLHGDLKTIVENFHPRRHLVVERNTNGIQKHISELEEVRVFLRGGI